MIQKWPQPQLVLIIIAIPIRNVTSPTGANTFSPMNAACFATVTIPSGSFGRLRPDRVDHDRDAAADPDHREEHVHCLEERSTSCSAAPLSSRTRRSPRPRRLPRGLRSVRLLVPRLGAADPVAGVSIARSKQVSRRVSRLRAAVEPLVDVGHVARLVLPAPADDAVLVDEERGPPRDVAEATKLEPDPEPAHRLAVEVREEPEVEIERLPSRRCASTASRARCRPAARPTSSNSALLSRRSSISFVQVDDQSKR